MTRTGLISAWLLGLAVPAWAVGSPDGGTVPELAFFEYLGLETETGWDGFLDDEMLTGTDHGAEPEAAPEADDEST